MEAADTLRCRSGMQKSASRDTVFHRGKRLWLKFWLKAFKIFSPPCVKIVCFKAREQIGSLFGSTVFREYIIYIVMRVSQNGAQPQRDAQHEAARKGWGPPRTRGGPARGVAFCQNGAQPRLCPVQYLALGFYGAWGSETMGRSPNERIGICR